MASGHGENSLSNLMVVPDGRWRDRALKDVVAFLFLKAEREKQ